MRSFNPTECDDKCLNKFEVDLKLNGAYSQMNQTFMGRSYDDENDYLARDLKDMMGLDLRYTKFIIVFNDI